MTNANTPVESIERLFPVVIETYALEAVTSVKDDFHPGGQAYTADSVARG